MFKKIISSILALAMVAAMSTSVFATEGQIVPVTTNNEEIPTDMIVTATITDEFNNVTDVDVEYTVTEVPNLSRAANANKRYALTATATLRRETEFKDNVEGSITIYYEKTTGWFPMNNTFKIYTVAGYWMANGQNLSNRAVDAYSSGSGHRNYEPDPNYNSYSYDTGFGAMNNSNSTYVSSSVTINGSSNFKMTIRPN